MESAGISLSSSFRNASYPENTFFLSQSFHSPPFKTEGALLKSIAMKKLNKEQWDDFFVTDTERSSCVDAISPEKKLHLKVRQPFSDELSS